MTGKKSARIPTSRASAARAKAPNEPEAGQNALNGAPCRRRNARISRSGGVLEAFWRRFAHTKYARNQSVHFGSLTTGFFQRWPYAGVIGVTRFPRIHEGNTAALGCFIMFKAQNGSRSAVNEVNPGKTGHSDDPSIWPALKNMSREVDTFFQKGPTRLRCNAGRS